MRKYFHSIVLVCAVVLLAGITAVQGAATNEDLAKSNKVFERVDELIGAERLNEAVTVLKSIDAQSSETIAKVDTFLGEIFLRLDKPGKALEFFEQASFSTLDDARATLGLAKANLAMGKLRQARSHASFALKSDADLIDAHLVLAEIANRVGKVAEAEQRFADLKRSRRGSEPVSVAYASFLSQRGDTTQAMEELRTFVKRNPASPEAADLLGRFYWEQGKRKNAYRYRALAAEAFYEQGNVFRGGAIRSWLAANFPGAAVPSPVQPAPEVSEPLPPATETPEVVTPAPQIKKANALPPATLERPQPLPLDQNTQLSTGSGFIVSGGRFVITNRHVIDGAGKLAVRSGTGEVREAKVVGVAEDDDLAVLELSPAFPEEYAISFSRMDNPVAGRSAVVMGFPLAGMLGWQHPSLTEGIVSKASGIGDDPNTFLITSKMNKGNSGGPIFDRKGNLIGVAVAKLDSAKVFEKKGHLPEDVNIGIKISRVLAFLQRTGGGDVSGGAAPKNLEELYQAMLSKVVLVVGEVQ